ncbi:MAG: alpha/beta fold hydrolase [bacterium]|nr:alpha/beta fold hydrolase [bacterium]
MLLQSPSRPCRPPFWAKGGHAQTVLGHVLPVRAPRICAGEDGWEAHEVELEDGDRLRVLGAEAPGANTVVYFFHGLSGDANADYMRRGARVARSLGHAVVAANHRGCGDGRGLAVGPYHSGCKDDVAAVLAFGRERFPGRRHVAVGFSLSGNALLLLLARGGATLPDAAVAVHPPIDLADCARRIALGANRLYEMRFVHRLRRVLAQRVEDGLLRAAPRVPRSASLNDFDELYTAPAGGFADADDYYASCSTHELLHTVDVPSVVIIARDDPFVDWRMFERARRSARVHLHVEDHGGHMGYVSRGGRWLDVALEHYLTQVGAASPDPSDPA